MDDLEGQQTQGFDLPHYLGVVRRRHFQFLIPLFLGWAVVWSASWVIPPRYQSSTLILVEQPSMPKDYVTPNINDDLQARMQSITQQILSRTNLLEIIERSNLYAAEHAQASADDRVSGMRKDIDIELVKDSRNQITAFTVSYTSRNPQLAQQVTGELTNLFINENLEVRQHQSEDTTRFLEDQLEAARKDLAAQEDRISQFKAQHVGEMPGQLASNLQILQGVQSQLQTEEDSLNAARQQRVYLQTLADQYRSLQGVKGSDGAPVGGLPALDQRLEKLRTQLADLSSRYTDEYPDVRKIREEIGKTEKLRDQLAASLKNIPPENVSTGPDFAGTMGGRDDMQASALAPVQSQLRSNRLEITNREDRIAVLKAKVDSYQGRLSLEPVREQQLSDLTRGYEQSKANYDDLLKKKNESKMATSMELLQQGERFRVVDPPSLPLRPEFPNRLKFCGIGLGVGFALGIAVAGAFEFFDDRVHNVKALRKLLPAEVIGEIPEIVNETDGRSTRRNQWLGWVTAVIVFAMILAGSAFSYLRG